MYAVFGNKLRLAQEIIWTTFEVEGIHELLSEVISSPDPEAWLRSGARIARLVGERLGSLLLFLQESGDPDLRAEYRKVQDRRLEQERHLAVMLHETGRLKEGLSPEEALDVLWAMTGSRLHHELVEQRGWSGHRYEEWLGDALIHTLLTSP